MPDLALLFAFLVVLGLQQWTQERERVAWKQERQALLARLVPGLQLEPPPVRETPRAFGTDEDEWRVEQRRLKNG